MNPWRFEVLLFAVAMAASGCAKNTQSATSTSQATALPSRSVAASVAASVPTDTPAAVVSGAPAAVVSSAPVATVAAASPAPSVAPAHFTDLAGTFAKTQIEEEAQLGIFDPAGTTFRPHDPLTRAEYVRWLVRANNVYFASNTAKQIRLAETSADPIFSDVAPSRADYKYIQGMADAGYVIGIDKTHFAPSRNLTREELIAIIVSRDQNGKPGTSTLTQPDPAFSDANQISKPYWGAFHDDAWDYAMNTHNLHRVFGTVKTFHPKRAATREEAALALAQIDGAGVK